MEYLNRPNRDFNLALVDEWIVKTRGTPLETRKVPAGMAVRIVPFTSSGIPAELLGDGNGKGVGFFAGSHESVKELLERNRALHPDLSWVYLQSWTSLEIDERSIHAYRLFLKE